MLSKDYFRFRVAIINIAITPDNAIPFTYRLAEQIRSPVSAVSYFSPTFFFQDLNIPVSLRIWTPLLGFGPPQQNWDHPNRSSRNI